MNVTSDNMRGAAFMMISMAAFVLNDTAMKSIAGEVEIFQAVFLRGIFTTTLLGILAWRTGAFRIGLARRDRPVLALRLVGELGGTTCFLTALFHMPIANATAILQAMPLTVTLAAAMFLGEVVGWRRYLAISFGFVGVMIIVRPGAEGFNVYSVWALAAVMFVTLRDLTTRRLSRETSSSFVTFCTAVAITLLGACVSAVGPWKPVTDVMLERLALSACFLAVGYLFSVLTMRVGEIAFVSPFRYTILVWAILLGIVVFDEYPDRYSLIGAAIVVGTGVYTFYREQRAARSIRLVSET